MTCDRVGCGTRKKNNVTQVKNKTGPSERECALVVVSLFFVVNGSAITMTGLCDDVCTRDESEQQFLLQSLKIRLRGWAGLIAA